MRRLSILAVIAVVLTYISTLGQEPIQLEVVPTTTPVVTVTYPLSSLQVEPLIADDYDSEVILPEVPDLPQDINYEPLDVSADVDDRVWDGRIPEEYGPGTGCTRAKANIIARAMWDKGASDSSVEWMLYVISRESLCDSSAHNGDRSTGDDSWGLCQQNNLSGWFDEGNLLYDFDRFSFADDFALNVESCAVMWEECGQGPWTKGDYGCRTPKELR